MGILVLDTYLYRCAIYADNYLGALVGRRDWNEPRYYAVDPWLDTTATEAPESATTQVPGIETARSEFNNLRIIEKDIMDRYIVDGEIITAASFDIANKLLEDTENACFVFPGTTTYVYWKWIGGGYANTTMGDFALQKGEIMSRARSRLEAGS